MPRDSRSVSPDVVDRTRHRDRSRSPWDRSRDWDRHKDSRKYDDEGDNDGRRRDHPQSESKDRDRYVGNKSHRMRDRSESEERDRKKYALFFRSTLNGTDTHSVGASATSPQNVRRVRRKRSGRGRKRRLVELRSSVFTVPQTIPSTTSTWTSSSVGTRRTRRRGSKA